MSGLQEGHPPSKEPVPLILRGSFLELVENIGTPGKMVISKQMHI